MQQPNLLSSGQHSKHWQTCRKALAQGCYTHKIQQVQHQYVHRMIQIIIRLSQYRLIFGSSAVHLRSASKCHHRHQDTVQKHRYLLVLNNLSLSLSLCINSNNMNTQIIEHDMTSNNSSMRIAVSWSTHESKATFMKSL